MPSTTPNSKSASIGIYGGVPYKGEVETTVLTVGGKTIPGFAITIVHVVTWITAILLISLWGNSELSKYRDHAIEAAKQLGADDPKVVEAATAMGTLYAAFIGGILVMVIVHSALARREEAIGSTLATVVLLAMVGFENTLGCAYVAYSLFVDDSNFYTAALVSQSVVCLGSAMIVSFLLNWSHRGNVKPLDFGSSQP